MSQHVYSGPPGQDSAEQFAIYHPPVGTATFVTNPEKTGLYESRKAVHATGLWHRAVHVWLYDPTSKKILLQQRSVHKDTNPGLWDISAAGHITGADPVNETATREVGEELGADIPVEKLQFLFTAISQSNGEGPNGPYEDNEYQDVFVTTAATETTQFKIGESEVAAIRWMPAGEVHAKLLARDAAFVRRPQHYIEELFAKLSGL
eukprot:TRINITY_DN45401_c0_g1_i1.p1 TRINITY_DN45401_c0_g1~~TRINITY_DN45401_c0_g1_i1.p1  ORF type:complete len:206 (+),score=29.44 TRINITY_DN45401_c0_g1_i1:34-651(+)